MYHQLQVLLCVCLLSISFSMHVEIIRTTPVGGSFSTISQSSSEANTNPMGPSSAGVHSFLSLSPPSLPHFFPTHVGPDPFLTAMLDSIMDGPPLLHPPSSLHSSIITLPASPEPEKTPEHKPEKKRHFRGHHHHHHHHHHDKKDDHGDKKLEHQGTHDHGHSANHLKSTVHVVHPEHNHPQNHTQPNRHKTLPHANKKPATKIHAVKTTVNHSNHTNTATPNSSLIQEEVVTTIPNKEVKTEVVSELKNNKHDENHFSKYLKLLVSVSFFFAALFAAYSFTQKLRIIEREKKKAPTDEEFTLMQKELVENTL